MGALQVWCSKIIQSEAAYLYWTGTRVDHLAKNNRRRIFARVSTFLCWTLWRITSWEEAGASSRVYTWRVVKAKVRMWSMNFTERFTLFVNLQNCVRPEVYLNPEFFFAHSVKNLKISLNPCALEERLEISPFISMMRELSSRSSSNEFTEGLRFNLPQ